MRSIKYHFCHAYPALTACWFLSTSGENLAAYLIWESMVNLSPVIIGLHLSVYEGGYLDKAYPQTYQDFHDTAATPSQLGE